MKPRVIALTGHRTQALTYLPGFEAKIVDAVAEVNGEGKGGKV